MAKDAIVTVRVADAPAVVAALEQAAERIETLERAILKSWEGDLNCVICEEQAAAPPWYPLPHAPDCIVPALLEKYPDA